jgi:hypothetical protein
MDLRPELLPPILDEVKVGRLAKLAAMIDGANPGQWEDELAEFNELAGTSLGFGDFRGIYGGEEHATWVRRLLVRQQLRPALNVTPAELEEVVRRAMPQNHDPEYEAYMQIFEVNVPLEDAANLIFMRPITTRRVTPGAAAGRNVSTRRPQHRLSSGRWHRAVKPIARMQTPDKRG